MFLASEPLAVLDLHHLPGPWMERIEDSHVERRTPGIVTLVRPASGKSWLACALGHKACRDDRSVLYHRVATPVRRPRARSRRWPLCTPPKSARRRRTSHPRRLGPRTSDAAAAPRPARNSRRSLRPRLDHHHQPNPRRHWHELIGDPTYADAILDRIVHNAHRLALTGHSMRRSRANKAAKD